MIHAVATIEVKPGKRDEFLQAFKRNVPNVRAEEGCLGYEPVVDVDSGLSLQIPLREDVVTVIEKWKSIDHLRAHLDTPHMAAYQKEVKDLVVQVTAQVLTPA